jgi:hypothetical protein
VLVLCDVVSEDESKRARSVFEGNKFWTPFDAEEIRVNID